MWLPKAYRQVESLSHPTSLGLHITVKLLGVTALILLFVLQAAPKPPTASKASLAEEESLTDESDNDSEQEGAMDMDLNTVKNLLESYSSQMGLPGPTSNILESMGLHLPQNADWNMGYM